MPSTSVVPTNSTRQRLKAFIENSTIQRILLALILVNAVILGLETSKDVMTSAGPFLIALDKAILAVFVVELTIRLLVHRLVFFKDGWNVFDFIVVGIALVPASGPFAVLRAQSIACITRADLRTIDEKNCRRLN
ncbi:ion transporter [Marinomonas sp.]|uniref:ion transporter n=1 Tax=Marinomonas sp. TaxID=1904862 RepID=UPI003BA86686